MSKNKSNTKVIFWVKTGSIRIRTGVVNKVLEKIESFVYLRSTITIDRLCKAEDKADLTWQNMSSRKRF